MKVWMQRDEGRRSEITVSDGNKYLSMPDKIATKLVLALRLVLVKQYRLGRRYVLS